MLIIYIELKGDTQNVYVLSQNNQDMKKCPTVLNL